jgi:hypothetical protein
LVHLLSNISGLFLNRLFSCLLHPGMQFSVGSASCKSLVFNGWSGAAGVQPISPRRIGALKAGMVSRLPPR